MKILTLSIAFFSAAFMFLDFGQAKPLTRATFEKLPIAKDAKDRVSTGVQAYITVKKNTLKKDPETIKLLKSQGRTIDSMKFDSIIEMIAEDFITIRYQLYKARLSEEDALDFLKLMDNPSMKKVTSLNSSKEFIDANRQFGGAVRSVADREIQKILKQNTAPKK